VDRHFRNFLQGLRQSVNARPNTKRRKNARRGLLIEGLEERTLLSTLTLSGGMLTYQALLGETNNLAFSSGPPGEYTLHESAANINIVGAIPGATGSGTHDVAVPVAGVTAVTINVNVNQNAAVNVSSMPLANSLNSLTVNGGSGADLTIDNAPGALFDPAGGIAFNGNGNANTLILTGNPGGTSLGGTYTTGAHDPQAGNAGTLQYTQVLGGVTHTQTINFTGLSPVEDLTPAATFTINEGAAPTSTINVVQGPLSTNPDPITGNKELTYQVNFAGLAELVNFRNKVAVTVNANNTDKTITMNLPAKVDAGATSLTSLQLNGGTGMDQYVVLATPAGVTTTLDGKGGANTAKVGDTTPGVGVQNIKGAVVVQDTGGAGSTALTVDDSTDMTGRSATISDTQVSGLAPAPISYTAGSLSSLTVKGGTPAAPPPFNTFTVTGTPAGITTTVQGGAGNDAFIVDEGAALAGNLTVVSGGGTDSLTVNGAGGGDAFTITATTISDTPITPATITYDNPNTATVAVAQLTINGVGSTTFTVNNTSTPTTLIGGTSPDTFTVNGTGLTGPVTLMGAAGNDTFTISDAAALQGNVTVVSGGGTDTLAVNGAGGDAFTITATTISNTPVTPATITYDSPSGPAVNVAQLTVASIGASSFTVTSTSTPTTLQGSPGNDTFTISEAALAGAVTVLGGGGTDALIVLGAGADTYTINGTTIQHVGSQTITYDNPSGPTVNVASLLVTGVGGSSFTVNGTSTPTTLQGDAANDTFLINESAALVANVTVISGGGTDSLTVNGAGGGDIFTITATTISDTPITPATITYDNPNTATVAVAQLTINGVGSTTFTVNNTSTPTKLIGGTSPDIFTVNGTGSTGPVTLMGAAGNDTFTISDTAALQGNVTVISGGGTDTLAVNGAGGDAFTITATTISNTPVTPATITYDSPSGPAVNVAQLTVASIGASSFTVNSTSTPTTLQGSPGNDTFTISEAALAGAVTVLGGGGTDALIVLGAGADTYTINGTTIQHVGSQTITYDNPSGPTVNVASLLVTGVGGSSFTVNGTSTPTTLQGDAANDTFLINESAALVANVTVISGGGTDSLTVNGAGGGDAFTITATTISDTPITPATITYDNPNTATVAVAQLTINGVGSTTFTINNTSTPTKLIGGTSPDTFTVNGTGSTGPVTLMGAAGNDTFTISDTAALQGNVTVISGGGTDTLTVNGAGGDAFMISATTISNTPVTPATITYDNPNGPAVNVAQLTVASAGASSFTVTSTSTPTTLQGSPGNDTFTISEAALAGAVTVLGGGGTDALIVLGAGADTYTINGTTIQHVGSQTITYDNPSGPTVNVASLLVTGVGGSSFTVNGTSTPTTLQGDAANDTFLINESAALVANVTVISGGGTDTLTVNGAGGGDVFTITATTISDTRAPATITYDNPNTAAVAVAQLTINGVGSTTFTVNNTSTKTLLIGGTSPNSFTVNATGSTGPVTLMGASGNDTFTISDTPALQGNVTVISGGGTDTLAVNGAGGDAFTITATTITNTLAPAAITYDNPNTAAVRVAFLNVASLGNDTFTVAGTSTVTTVNTGTGMDVVMVGNATDGVQDINGALSIGNNGGAGNAVLLTVNDVADTTPRTGVVISSNAITGLAPATISYSNLGSLHVQGGSGSSSNPFGNVFTVASTPLGIETDLDTGTGMDMTTVQKVDTSSTLKIHGQAGLDSVVISNAGNAQDVRGAVTVDNVGGSTALTVDDSADSAFKQSATLTDGHLAGPGAPNITYFNLRSLTVKGGTQGNTFMVVSTTANIPTTIDSGTGQDLVLVATTGAGGSLTINGQGGQDLVVIGSNHSVQGIFGTVNVTNSGGVGNLTDLTVDDSADAGAKGTIQSNNNATDGVVITRDNITFLAPAAINYNINGNQNTLNTLTIDGGSGGNIFTLNTTPQNTITTLNSGAGNDAVFIRETDGQTFLNGQGGNDQFSFVGAVPGGLKGGMIDGGPGLNTLDYSPYTGGPVEVNLSNQSNLSSNGVNLFNNGTPVVGLPAGFPDLSNTVPAPNSATGTGGIVHGTIQNVIGGRGSGIALNLLVADTQDKLEGGAVQDVLIGLNGNDTLIAGGNDQTIAGRNILLLGLNAHNFLVDGTLNDINRVTAAGAPITGVTDPGFQAGTKRITMLSFDPPATGGPAPTGDTLLINSCAELRLNPFISLSLQPTGVGTIDLVGARMNENAPTTNPDTRFKYLQNGAQTTVFVQPTTFAPPPNSPNVSPLLPVGAPPVPPISDPAQGRLVAAAGFLTSAENRTDLVAGYYQRYLGRTPDAGGLQTWLGAFAAGATQEDVVAAILGSAEYHLRHGGTNAGFVTGLYHDLLGRTPAQSEIDGWLGVLGHFSRTTVAMGFLTSTEFRTDLIVGWYQQYLVRSVDAGGLAYWLGQMQQGKTDEQIQIGILTSTEYQQRVNSQFPHGDEYMSFIMGLYADVLKRTPSQQEVMLWLGVVEEV
jgi:hypothetical protein